MLPPGCAKLATRPVPSGSPANAKTIGISTVVLLCRDGCCGSIRDDEIDLQADQLDCHLGEARTASLRPAIFHGDRATLDPAEFAQPLDKGGGQLAPGGRGLRAKEPDDRHLPRLLCPRRERPCSRATEQRDKLAALHCFPCMQVTPNSAFTEAIKTGKDDERNGAGAQCALRKS
jgi:hypothetical protein